MMMASDMPASDNRRYDRLERDDEIKVKEFRFPETGRYRKARITDISGGGLMIETRQHYSADTQLKIEINLTGWQRYAPGFLKYFGEAAQRPLVVLAQVIRCDTKVVGHKYDVAVEFSGIDENHRRALVKFIREKITKNR
jgi:c-di-GMP-binding flagellar brake protein YcgR